MENPNEPGRTGRDAFDEFQSKLERAVEDLKPKVRKALDELDSSVDAAVADLRPKVRAKVQEAQPRVDAFIADIQPRMDSILRRVQSKLEEVRQELETRAARPVSPDAPVDEGGGYTPPSTEASAEAPEEPGDRQDI